MFLKHFPNTFIALIHDSDKTKPVLHKKTLKSSDIPAGYGAFFTVNGFRNERKKDKLSHISGVFADVDQKEGKSSLQDIQQMVFMDLPPTFINETKNGWHLIWMLTEPITDITPELVQTVEGINRRFVEMYGADNAAVDVGHLLRIPRTEHRKNPAEPFVIKTVYETDDTYTLEELVSVYEPSLKAEIVVEYGEVTGDVQARLDRMLQKPNIKQLWDGDIPEDKLSESDIALCNHLAFWLAKDAGAMEQAWLQSPLGQREKAQKRADYRKLTIDKAIANTKDVYTPKTQITTTTEGEDVVFEKKCYERIAYKKYLQEDNWDDKDWVKGLKVKKTNYVLAFHNYFSIVFPYLRYEIGEPKTYWQYDEDEGVYREMGINSAVTLVVELLIREGLTEYATESTAKTVLTRYRSMYRERGSEYDDFDKDDVWLHVKNGWVNLLTLNFEPHTPNRLSKIKSTVDYDVSAECPRYDQFIETDLQLKPDQVRVIDQFSGLSLTNDIKYQKMLTLTGRTGCGKSTLLDAWGYVVGDMMIEKKLTELQNDSMRFAGTQFVGKRLCWFDEVDVKRSEMGNSLGTLVTGQYISVERKGIDGIVKAQNTLKCVLTANRLPLSAEVGIFRRLILIQIRVSFSESGTEDREMHVKLKEEASGILNRMIRGLHDLRKMGGFTLIEGHDDLIEEYKASSDTVAEFLNEYFEPGTIEDKIPTKVLFNTYQRYTEGNSFVRSISPQKFGQLLASQPLTRFAHIDKVRSFKEGRSWSGLRVKSEYKIDNNMEVLVAVLDGGF